MVERVALEPFLTYLAAEMSWDVPLAPATQLDDELCVDSVARYELLCVVEDLGVVLDEAQLGAWQSVGDLYDAYTVAPSSGGLVRQLPGHGDGGEVGQWRPDDLQPEG